MAIKTVDQTLTRPPSDGRAYPAERDKTLGFVVYAAVALSLVAALIHLWAAPEHFTHWWAYGVFFVAVALAQGLLSLLILRWPESNLVPLAGVWGNLVIVAMYVVSRTWGMPLGPNWVLFSPDVAHIEDPEVLGMTATAAEVGIIILLVAMMGDVQRRWTVNILLSLGVLLWGMRFLGILP